MGWLNKYVNNKGVKTTLNGQWEFPGEVTKIPSNQITMQGVPYPVLGISDTGDTQLMQPDQNYSFNGESVTEYPMTDGWLNKYQDGGEIPKAQNGKKVTTAYKSEEDPLTREVKRGLYAGAKGLDKAEEMLRPVGNAIGNFLAAFTPHDLDEQGREKIFNTFRPVSYPGIGSTIGQATKSAIGKGRAPSKDKEGDWDIGEEAWRKTLGLSTKDKYIKPSKHRPLNEKDPSSKYYALPDVIDVEKLRTEIKKQNIKPGQKVNMESMSPFIKEGFMNPEEFYHVDPMQKFQLGVNKAGKPYYYDKYDFDFAPAEKVIRPYKYEFYDEFENGGTVSSNNWLSKYK